MQTASPNGTGREKLQAYRKPDLGLLGLENLLAAIHAGLQVDMVRAAQFARILVLDIGRGGQGSGGTAEPALHQRGLALWNGHFGLHISTVSPNSRRDRSGSVGKVGGSI